MYRLIPLLLCSSLLTAQATTTEATIHSQKRFIEAKQTALLGKIDEAITMFRAIVDEDADNDAALFELARLEHAAENTTAGIEALRAARKLRPESDIYISYLAELYQAAGRYADGAELFARLVKRYPDNDAFYLRQADFLARANQPKEAIEVYDDLEKRTGVTPELTRLKHALYLGIDDERRAERELENLIEAFPKRIDYRHLLAGFYNEVGRDRKAREVYEEILAIQPADVRAQLALQGEGTAPSSAATDDSELMALLARTDVELDLKIGKLLPSVQRVAETNDRALADRLLPLVDELQRVHPDAAKAATIEGDLYYHTGRWAEAAEAYRATLELDDTVYPVWQQLLSSLYLDNQMAELRGYASAGLDLFPNRFPVYVYAALGEAFRGSFDDARSLLDEVELMIGEEDMGALSALRQAVTVLEDETAEQPDYVGLPGGTDGPLAFYLRQRDNPDPSALASADHPRNTNALLLELMAAQTNDATAAEDYRTRARAAGSKTNF